MHKLTTTLNLQECVEIIKNNCSGQNALNFVEEIANFHRIQASQGYRAAASCGADLLRENGVDVRIQSYPADGKTYCFTQKLFKEWNCEEGWLEITAPWHERLADFSREEMSIIQRSAAKDFSNQDVPIIYVEDHVSPTDFNTSLRGALLFVENDFDQWSKRASELGALGIITVSMPEIKPVRTNMAEDEKMAHSHANLSFHIYNSDQEDKLCGFAISPHSGRRLREACAAGAADGKTPRARFKISSTLTEGSIENVEAVIQGTTDEEILMVAHLCHPRSSVNDNASGVGAAMEAMCVLGRLIENGTLPRPRRSIRLLLMPEFTGTYAFLHDNEDRLSKIRAGINLDMVAAYQNGNAGPSIIVDTPDSAHSFSGDLASLIVNQLAKECAFGGKDRYVPLFLSVKVPFVFGSDHYILSDPTIDIPTVALTQWPDKTYHTSADNIDHIDPNMLLRSAALAGAYCYIYSRFTLEDANAVMQEVSSRFLQAMNNWRWQKASAEHQERLDYTRELYFATLDRFSTLFEGEELSTMLVKIEEEKAFFTRLEQASGLLEPGSFDSSSGDLSPIPVRLFKAPLARRSIRGDMTLFEKDKLTKLQSKYPECSSLVDYVIYETDGKRTIKEIARRVQIQTGLECENFVEELFELLVELKLISMTERKE